MATVAVRYVGPQDERYLPDLGVTVARDGVIEVSAEFAGTEPSGVDLGSGLLAQVDVWRRVKSRPGTRDSAAAAADTTPEG